MKIGFVSLGCPKNLVDTEVMMGQLVADGHELTPQPADADVIVINTCSFIDPAKQESVDTILEMAEYKKTGKAQRLVVAGCLVERFRADIQKNIPEVDAVLGTNELDKITALCEGIEPKELPRGPYLYHDLTERVFTTPRHSAYIKIAEGCDHPCTFCIIPQFRGNFRSRRFESVINEATRMFAMGVREINLIGQDTTCYGEDLGLKDGLAQLLARLAQIPTEQPKWVRFLYAYPNKVTQGLLDTIAAHESLVKYMDMPLQHASANVLKRMKRGAHADIFLKLLSRIRTTIPGVAVRTSMIVGFPGETDADFEELCQFVEAAQFDRLGVFSYSDEETSKSFALDAKVDKRTIYHRKRKLMAIQRRISLKRNKRLIGSEFPVLVEGRSKETDLLWEARLATQAPKSTASAISTMPNSANPAPAKCACSASRKRTITTWSAISQTFPKTSCKPPFATPTRSLYSAPSQYEPTASPFDNKNVRCPICKKEVAFNDPEMPFCSKRCRLIDLGNWADEKYKISTPTHQSEFSVVPGDEDEEESDSG